MILRENMRTMQENMLQLYCEPKECR